MMVQRKYRKPPVIEALCEVYFADSAWDDTIPGAFYELVKEQFPEKRQVELHEAQVTLTTVGEAAAGIRRLAPRMQFVSKKGDRLIQLGRDLLVVNQLTPYPRFDDWEPVVYSAVGIYRKLTQPRGISRLGLRYINRVLIPETRILLEDYFTVYPQLPRMMGDEHGRFVVRFELPSRKASHTLLVTFGSAPAEKPGEIAHLLDLYDIFKPPESIALDHASEEVKNAHDSIEMAFEGSITDKLRSLFGLENQ